MSKAFSSIDKDDSINIYFNHEDTRYHINNRDFLKLHSNHYPIFKIDNRQFSLKYVQFNRVWAKCDWQHAKVKHLHSNLLRFPSEWIFNSKPEHKWDWEFNHIIDFVKGLSTQDRKVIIKYGQRLEKNPSSKNGLLLINKFIERFGMTFWIKFPKAILDDDRIQNTVFEFWHKPTEKKIVKLLVDDYKESGRKRLSIRGLSLKKISKKFNDEMNQIVRKIEDLF